MRSHGFSRARQGIVEIFASFLVPLALSVQLPVFMFVIVMEKESGLREMQKQMGARPLDYVASHAIFNFCFYALIAGFFWISGAACGFRLFTQTDGGTLLALLAGWGAAQVRAAAAAAATTPKQLALVGR